MIAANIIIHPIVSLADNRSPKITQPDNTEKQDSKLKISDATAGLTFFCPRICKVYAIPQENTPA